MFEDQPKVNAITTTKEDSQIIIVIVSPQAQMMMMSLKCEEHAGHTFSKKVCFFSLARFIS